MACAPAVGAAFVPTRPAATKGSRPDQFPLFYRNASASSRQNLILSPGDKKPRCLLFLSSLDGMIVPKRWQGWLSIEPVLVSCPSPRYCSRYIWTDTPNFLPLKPITDFTGCKPVQKINVPKEIMSNQKWWETTTLPEGVQKYLWVTELLCRLFKLSDSNLDLSHFSYQD